MSRRRSSGGFRRRDALHGWTLHFGPNMTPMVDVVMVILVFFMASAAFMGDDWFLRAGVVDSPKPGAASASAAAPTPPDPLAQRLDVLLDRSPAGETQVTAFELVKAPLEAFTTRTRALPRGGATSKIEIIVRPVAAVPYQDVVRVHEACYAAGIEKVGLGTR
jgi:biopolymer transport protein ExbD